jgi:hypothetical protein
VGSVLAGAVVGAVLQGRLASSLKEQAAQRAGAVPPDYRPGFVRGFDTAGRHLDLAGHGAGAAPPAGTPDGAARRIADAAASVFGHGFVEAMRPTLLVPAVVLAVGALACLFVRTSGGASANPHGLPMSEAEIAAAQAAGPDAAAAGPAEPAAAQG